MNILIAVFGFLTAALIPTVVGSIICGAVTLGLTIMRIDYNAIYTGDHNADNSFDFWGEAKVYNAYSNYMVFDTPRYQWLATPLGVYAVVDKATGRNNWGKGDVTYSYGGGGGRARAN
jgi:hypothetical protein